MAINILGSSGNSKQQRLVNSYPCIERFDQCCLLERYRGSWIQRTSLTPITDEHFSVVAVAGRTSVQYATELL